jgi:DNA invertase Pin-like site-specific DNA recombinase
MLERLAPGDRLIVSELSRLGRSLGQVIHIVDELVKRKIRFTAIKESIHFEGK